MGQIRSAFPFRRSGESPRAALCVELLEDRLAPAVIGGSSGISPRIAATVNPYSTPPDTITPTHPQGFFADRDTVGYNADGYVITLNMFAIANPNVTAAPLPGGFDHTLIFSIPKANGGNSHSLDLANNLGASFAPAVMHGA